MPSPIAVPCERFIAVLTQEELRPSVMRRLVPLKLVFAFKVPSTQLTDKGTIGAVHREMGITQADSLEWGKEFADTVGTPKRF